jgi:hypothetical protein
MGVSVVILDICDNGRKWKRGRVSTEQLHVSGVTLPQRDGQSDRVQCDGLEDPRSVHGDSTVRASVLTHKRLSRVSVLLLSCCHIMHICRSHYGTPHPDSCICMSICADEMVFSTVYSCLVVDK